MNKKIVFGALIIFGILVLVICSYSYSRTSQRTYDLQVGQNRNFQQPGIIDQKYIYKNDQQLWAVIIYPDNNYRNSVTESKIYVTKKGETNIIQEKNIKETNDLAADEVPLHNKDWENGEYSVYFEREHRIVKKVDFKLE